MRRSARGSRSTAEDSEQIRLDFAAAGGTETVTASSAGSALRPARVESTAAAHATRGGTVVTLERWRPVVLERSAAEWFEIGCELEVSSPAEARTAYQHAIGADGRNVDAHLNLGRLLHEAGDLAGAERHYLRALEAEPDEATAAFNLGVVLEDLKRDEPAIAAYERAMRSDPDFVDAYHNAVRLHERRGDKAAAVRVLKRLRERTR